MDLPYKIPSSAFVESEQTALHDNINPKGSRPLRHKAAFFASRSSGLNDP